jgi:hypothetical protein
MPKRNSKGEFDGSGTFLAYQHLVNSGTPVMRGDARGELNWKSIGTEKSIMGIAVGTCAIRVHSAAARSDPKRGAEVHLRRVCARSISRGRLELSRTI